MPIFILHTIKGYPFKSFEVRNRARLVFALFLILSLVGCGESKASNTIDKTGTPQPRLSPNKKPLASSVDPSDDSTVRISEKVYICSHNPNPPSEICNEVGGMKVSIDGQSIEKYTKCSHKKYIQPDGSKLYCATIEIEVFTNIKKEDMPLFEEFLKERKLRDNPSDAPF